MQDLDHEYSCSRWSHRLGADDIITAYVRKVAQGSAEAKSSVECELGIPYGLGEREKLDIFGARTLPGEAPIFVFIHGGYWQEMCREEHSLMAPPLCKAGAVVVVVGYDLAPNIDIEGIIAQVRKAVGFVLTMATRRGSSGVYLSGHSAGGHLAAMALAHDWMGECMVSASLIRGAVLISGLYDLSPLVTTYINDPLKMTNETALASSPLTHLDQISLYSRQREIIVAVGDHDPPAFQKQSTDFNAGLVANGVRSSLVIAPDCDHFNIVENLDNPDFILIQDVGHAYSPSRFSHRYGPNEVLNVFIRTIEEGSEVAKSTVDCDLEVPYGPGEREKLDIFGADSLPGTAPIFVFIHGGYWQKLCRSQHGFMAPLLCKAGAIVVVVGYELAPNIAVEGIVDQVKKAVGFVMTMAKRRGSSGVYLSGHSAGGQLTAMALAHDWKDDCGVCPSMIRGAMLFAGVYDLTPLVGTYINEPLQMTHETAAVNSPMNHMEQITRRSQERQIVVVVGDHDPPEYIRQARELNTKLIEGGVDSSLVIVEDGDHFNIVENIVQPDFILTQKLLKMMNLDVENLERPLNVVEA